MKSGALILMSVLLAGCTANRTAGPATPTSAAGKCTPDGLGAFVGQKATAEVGTQMLAATGARALRWVPPRTAITMDYREDRLTVSYDDDMLITRASCG